MSPAEKAELVELLVECSRLASELDGVRERTPEEAADVIDLLVGLLESRNHRVAESN
jgi:hypothetical protein